MIGLRANDEGPVKDPDANLRLYDLLKRAEAEGQPVCDWRPQYCHEFMRARNAVGAGTSTTCAAKSELLVFRSALTIRRYAFWICTLLEFACSDPRKRGGLKESGR